MIPKFRVCYPQFLFELKKFTNIALGSKFVNLSNLSNTKLKKKKLYIFLLLYKNIINNLG